MALDTVEDAIAALERAVAKKGADYVYQSPITEEMELTGMISAGSCVYRNPDGSPSCIVAHVVLDTLGDGTLRRLGEGVAARAQSTLDRASRRPALEALQRAQEAQDQHLTWGCALEFAKNPEAYNAWKERGHAL